MKIYFVVADQIPVMSFASKQAAEQFCHLRPDLKVVEFDIPTDLGPNNVKANLREMYKLKQTLAGKTTEIPAQVPGPGLDDIIERRVEIHRASLENIHKQMARAKDNPDLPASALARMAEGACQQRQCPGVMAYGLLSLK